MLDDAEFAKRLAAHEAHADQLQAGIAETAQQLASLRVALITNGFSTDVAEDIARDWFCHLLAQTEATE